MSITKALTNYLNLFKPITVEQDAQMQHKAAQLEIAQSNETIKRAAYIRFMAQRRIAAIDAWLEATVFAELSVYENVGQVSEVNEAIKQPGESSNGQ